MHINVHEAKAKLSELIDLAAKGQKIVLCKRNVPYVELTPLSSPLPKKRPLGLAKGLIEINNDFFEPMPDEEFAAWDEVHSGDPLKI